MKKELRLVSGITWCILLMFSISLTAQINQTENFDTENVNWGHSGFYITNVSVCNGAGAAAAHLSANGQPGSETSAFLYSYNLGVSNGLPVTVSYKYKVVNYSSGTPTVPTPAEEAFGNIQLLYKYEETDEYFSVAETIDSSNQVTSLTCTARTVTMNVPAGKPLELAFIAELENNNSNVLVYIDEITAVQPDLPCTGAPDGSETIANTKFVCNNGSMGVGLSLSTHYYNQGIVYQWQESVNGLDFTNVPIDGTYSMYNDAPQISKWYRALITCTGSNSTIISNPVFVRNIGECLCHIQSATGAGSITLVNFAGINNTVPPNHSGNFNFFNVLPAEVNSGQSYLMTVKGNTYGDFTFMYKAYIDFNSNGDITDPGESFEIGAISNSSGVDDKQASVLIIIPEGTSPGYKQMRITTNHNTYTTNPCGEYDFGTGNDYLVNVDGALSVNNELYKENIFYYPNPVSDVLNVSYSEVINAIEVYNLVGQQVLVKAVNANNAAINVSGLAAGTYMVKVTASGSTKTIKVVKK